MLSYTQRSSEILAPCAQWREILEELPHPAWPEIIALVPQVSSECDSPSLCPLGVGGHSAL